MDVQKVRLMPLRLQFVIEEIFNDSVWGLKQIETRQNKMAKMACQIWRFNY
jgi:hypothetical protein